MLCSTYSLLALSSEQQNARHMLARLEDFVQKNWARIACLDDRAFIECAAKNLDRFHRYCRTRKLELHVIPAIRRVTRAADALIDELEQLGAAAASVFGLINEQLESVLELGAVRLPELRFSIEVYCYNMLKKLSAEEGKLFPVMRGLLSPEEWFSIASTFLSPDGGPAHLKPQPPLNRRKRPAELGFLADGRNRRSPRSVWEYGMVDPRGQGVRR